MQLELLDRRQAEQLLFHTLVSSGQLPRGKLYSGHEIRRFALKRRTPKGSLLLQILAVGPWRWLKWQYLCIRETLAIATEIESR